MIGRPRTIQPAAHLDAALWEAEQGTGLPLFRGFTGLWNYADREGRFEWKPRELKQVILPYWAGSMEDVMSALAARGFIVSYEVDARRYGSVVTFKKHQRVMPSEPHSVIPPPPKTPSFVHDDCTTSEKTGRKLGRAANSEGSPLTLPLPNLSLDQVGSEDQILPDHSQASAEDLTGSAREDDEPSEKKSPFKSDAERDAFGHWARLVWGKAHANGEARATPKRLTPFRARLREGATPETFRIACENVAASAFHFGDNETGALYIEPKTLFGNAEKLEGWLAKREPKSKPAPGLTLHEREQNERDAKLAAEILAGEWGPKAQAWGAKRKLGYDDLRYFREAIAARKVTRVARPPEKRPSRPPPALRELVSGVGRTMP